MRPKPLRAVAQDGSSMTQKITSIQDLARVLGSPEPKLTAMVFPASDQLNVGGGTTTDIKGSAQSD